MTFLLAVVKYDCSRMLLLPPPLLLLLLLQVCEALRGRVRYIFIENICNDPGVLQQNYLNKMMYSPDYQGVDTEQVSLTWRKVWRRFGGGFTWGCRILFQTMCLLLLQVMCSPAYQGMDTEQMRQ
jgi:hypothetical protein